MGLGGPDSGDGGQPDGPLRAEGGTLFGAPQPPKNPERPDSTRKTVVDVNLASILRTAHDAATQPIAEAVKVTLFIHAMSEVCLIGRDYGVTRVAELDEKMTTDPTKHWEPKEVEGNVEIHGLTLSEVLKLAMVVEDGADVPIVVVKENKTEAGQEVQIFRLNFYLNLKEAEIDAKLKSDEAEGIPDFVEDERLKSVLPRADLVYVMAFKDNKCLRNGLVVPAWTSREVKQRKAS